MKKEMTKKQLEKALEGLRKECALPNWDGYNANALNKKSLKFAKSFLAKCGKRILPTSVGADTDGCVTFEWYKSQTQQMSISFEAGGKIAYAATIYGTKAHGYAWEKELLKELDFWLQ